MLETILAGGIIYILLAIASYFLPWIIAKYRNSKNSGWIFIFNLFFGVTGIVWIILLVWAILSESNGNYYRRQIKRK